MIPSDETIAALREALRVSPTNVPLHKHLAESLLKLGRFDEAETAYREGLAVAPHHVELKLGLAGAYYQQQKNSPALVVIEDLLEQSDPPAEAYVWHAKLLMRAGEPQRAAYQYRRGDGARSQRGRRGAGPRAGHRHVAPVTTKTKSSMAASGSAPAICRPGRSRATSSGRRRRSPTSAAWTRSRKRSA